MSGPASRTRSRAALASDTWETLFRAQSKIERELQRANTWDEVSGSEYGVLYELTRWPDGARFSDLQADELLTQPGLSRLVARLERRGLVHRAEDPVDRRAARLTLTPEGRALQRRLGTQHVRQIGALMNLPDAELEQLERLCAALIESLPVAANLPTTESTP